MSKITLTRLTSLTNEESAINKLNEWAEILEEFSDLLLSRNGQTPNTMTANLDMNSNRILNVAAPVNDNDLVRLIDVAEGIQGPQGDPGPAGSVDDGDKGDIVVSGAGAVWTLDPGVVTSAARTVLDDSTVADMRTTLGLGAAATKNVGTASTEVAVGNDTRFDRFAVSAQNADYSLPLTSAPTLFTHTSGTPHTYTISANSTTPYNQGVQILVHNTAGSADLTIARDTGVALYINGSTTSSNGTVADGGIVSLINIGTNSWLAIGPGIA